MACVTHLKHTIGSVITVDTGTSLLAPERVPDEGNRHGQYHAATRHHRSQGFGRTIVRRSTLGKGIRARSQCVRRPLKGGSDGGARRDPSPLRGDGRRRRNDPRAVLLDGSVDPRVVRSGDPSDLSAPQPDFGRAFGNRCRGRLWAWRTRPLFRYRPSVPAAVQADPPYRAGRRVSALSAVGPWPQNRAIDPVCRRMPSSGQIRSDDPHRIAGGALSMGRTSAFR